VSHDDRIDPDGALSATARQLLLDTAQQAVRRLRFRMCIVWSNERCSYVEVDRINESTSLPSGGVLTPFPVRFEDRESLTTGRFQLVGPGVQRRDPRTLN
jgi:hypothetical protein